MKRRILVVDDEHEICQLIKVHFANENVEVACAYDGHTALLYYHLSIQDPEAIPPELKAAFDCLREASCLSEPFDAILMDLALPGLNGATVVDNIRNLEKQSTQLKRVYIIGFSAFDERVKSSELDKTVDFDDYVAKPDRNDELLGKLTGILRAEL